MVWVKIANTAQFKGANWDNFEHKESNCTSEKARRIAFAKPEITFYFFCRQSVILGDHGIFNSGDAVFFTGRKWLGSAPQCDTYEKKGTAVAYINPNNSTQFRNIGNYTLPDGMPVIDVVCLFAGNYCTNDIPCLRAGNNQPPTTKPFNSNIQEVLSDGSLRCLQEKGIVVLLTVLNGHTQVGWSQFTSEAIAQSFVNYLKSDVVEKYGLDGIDIDDEYSAGTDQVDSLAMVTTLLKTTMPDKLLTKALFNDLNYFSVSWKHHKLAHNLNYGWEMSYTLHTRVKQRLQPYTKCGMNAKSLCLGFSAESQFDPYHGTIISTMEKVMADGYGGGMLFDYESTQGPTLMKMIVDAMMSEEETNIRENVSLEKHTDKRKNKLSKCVIF